MKSKLLFAGACLAVVAIAPPAGAVGVDGDPVLYWNELLIQSLTPNPVFASRHAAMLNIAVHDAVNAAQGRPNYGYLGSLEKNGGDPRAAASAAAHAVLKSLYPANAAVYDAALASSLALVPDGAAKTKGIATGAGLGALVLSRRAGDGWNAVVTYTPSGEPGRWAPTPPAGAPGAVPQWGSVDPFLLTSGDQFRSGSPPALGSAAYTAAFNEVRDIGSATSLLRTADQSTAANYWVAASGPGPWIRAAIDASESAGTSMIDNAALLARMNVAIVDATIGIFDAKYHFDYWRPVTAIRAADLDGNADTVQDAAWTPYVITPPHPSYISGHSGVASSAAAILVDAFGDGAPLCIAWTAGSRCWDSFTAASEDAAMSRLWGGIHWRFDNQAGLDLGRSVAAWTLDANAFGAVPEPGNWAMMIAGFGLIGAAMRRRVGAAAL